MPSTGKLDKAKAKDMLAQFDGVAPYDGPSNTVRNDGYFGSHIEREFGMKLAELRKACA